MHESVFEDSVSEVSAEPLLLAGVVSHVLEDRCRQSRTTQCARECKRMQENARECKRMQENARECKRMQENGRISKKEETAFCCISSLWDSSFFSSGCFIGSYGNTTEAVIDMAAHRRQAYRQTDRERGSDLLSRRPRVQCSSCVFPRGTGCGRGSSWVGGGSGPPQTAAECMASHAPPPPPAPDRG